MAWCCRPRPCSGNRRARGRRPGCAFAPADLRGLPADPAVPRGRGQAREARKGDGKIGTTGRGIGPAYEEVARRAIRVQDLFNPRCSTKLAEVLDYHNFVLTKYLGAEAVSANEVRDQAMALAPAIAPWSGRVQQPVRHATGRQAPAVRRRAGRAVGRGPRHLPLRHQQQLPGGRGLGRRRRRSAVARLRAGHHQGLHDPRGLGPVPDRAGRRDRHPPGHHRQEFGSVTGRPRRCGWFDAPRSSARCA